MNLSAAPSAVGKTLDDWLSPILVKELRQGMRGRIFVISFLLLQLFLVVLTLGNLAAQEDRPTLEVQNGFFWTILGFALLALTPMRGLLSIAGEVKNRTLETIMLTRLTAWRVVFGKWIALFAQSVLLVSAVLPYVVLRYFIGGDDVVSDFIQLFLLLWLSGLLIAASITISALENAVIRVIVSILLVGTIGTVVGNFINLSSALGASEVAWLALGLFVHAILFELAASGIAPASENHAIRRRLLAVAFFAGACVLEETTGKSFPAGLFVALTFLIGVCYFELSEKARLLPRMSRAFARHGWWGKGASFLLLPGWPSGLLFSLLVVPTALVVYFFYLSSGERENWPLIILSVLGSILVPVAFCHLVWRKMNQVLLVVLFYNIGLIAVAGIVESFQNLTHTAIDRFLIVLPGLPTFIAIHAAKDGGGFADIAVWMLVGNFCVLGLIIALLLLESRSYFRQLLETFRAPTDGLPAAPSSEA